MVAFADKPELRPSSVAEWDVWLERHADDPAHAGGVRLRLRKKAADVAGILYGEALDVALCHGWIDGQSKSIDETWWHQSFGPRRAASPWSQVNREHVERLIREGRMREGGYAEIERAKADGRWDAAYRVAGAEAPEELAAAIAADPAAAAAWASLGKSARWPFIFRVQALKRPESRQRRAAEYAALLARGERLR